LARRNETVVALKVRASLRLEAGPQRRLNDRRHAALRQQRVARRQRREAGGRIRVDLVRFAIDHAEVGLAPVHVRHLPRHADRPPFVRREEDKAPQRGPAAQVPIAALLAPAEGHRQPAEQREPDLAHGRGLAVRRLELRRGGESATG
jgi:hypothetical protein